MIAGHVTTAAILISDVQKRFGTTHAVRGLNLTVPRGSLCGFLGPNGAGKSTTIRMIMSIIHPDSGTIDVLGGSALASKDRIGYLPEERGVYRKMRVGDFLQYIAALKGVPAAGRSKRVADWLDKVQLPGVFRKRCEELSKGMQQKVQFIAAVIHEPELLILDEPFSGLDPVNAELLGFLVREQHRGGTTVIFSTHVLQQAEEMCERIVLIHKGEKLLDATLPEIRDRFDPRTILVEPLGPGRGIDGLASLAGVRAARLMPGSPAIELELVEGTDPQRVMVAAQMSTPMRRVELRRLSLTEVFVRLVMRDAGAAAAEQAREELSHV
jgi:ABC-2 type transport system ATP-binding protein